jgi:outer membrane cobalamin receptor
MPRGHIRPLALGALLIATAASRLPAQSLVRGTVREGATGRPLASASVRLAGTSHQTAADAAGGFALRGIPAGSYQLTVRHLGFAPEARPITLAGGDTLNVDVSLNPAAIPLSDIVVTPSRFGVADERAAATATLSHDDVETLPQLGEDVYRAIQRLPGLSTYDFTARFWVRGAPNDEVLARLDGVELLEPFHLKDLDASLSIVDVETVGNLTLTTGGFTAEYGDRLAGVLEMETLSDGTARPRTTLGLSITSVRASSRGQFAGGRGRWLASARRGYLDIVLKLIDAQEGIDPRYYDLGGKVEYQLGAHHRVSAHVLRAGDALTYGDEDEPQLDSRYGSSYAWLGWQAAFGQRVTARTVLSGARLSWRRTGLGAFAQVDSLDLQDRRGLDLVTLRQDWTAALADRLALRWGYDLRTGWADYGYFAWRERTVLDADTLARVRDTTIARLAPTGTAFGVYVAPRVRPLSPLTLEAGLRLDRHSWTGEHTWSPRVNAAYALGRRTTIRAAWGLYHQAHGLHQLAVQDGDPRFYPAERAEHRVLGLEHQLGSGIALRAEAYERRSSRLRPRFVNLNDYTEVFPEVQGDRARLDPTRGRARGLELLAERRLGGKLDWSLSYGAAVTEEEISGTLVPRIRDQRHTVAADVTYAPDASWRLSWGWQFHTGWPFTGSVFALDTLASGDPMIVGSFGPVNADRLPAYHRFDLRVTRRFTIGRSVLRVFLDLFNAYDRTNLNGYDYRVSVSGGRAVATRSGQELLPRLPTIGASWEF